MAAKDIGWRHLRVPEVYLSSFAAFVQVFTELFKVHADRCTEARRFEGQSYGSVADTPLQPLL